MLRSIIYIEKPAPHWEEAFLEGVKRSRRLYAGLVSPPRTAALYEKWLERLKGPAHRGFLLLHHEYGLVGVVNVNEIVRGIFQSAYLGYYVFAGHERMGYMTAGVRLVLQQAFGPMQLHRLEANIQPHNTASIALVRRLNFSYEGHSPRYLKIGGRWRDHERWALLKEDWRKKRPAGNASQR